MRVVSVGEGERFGAIWPSAHDKAASVAATYSDGPTLDAPDCIADQDQWDIRAAAGPSPRPDDGTTGTRFGAAQRIAFRPSPHPRIRWTVAPSDSASRARGQPRTSPPRVPICTTGW